MWQMQPLDTPKNCSKIKKLEVFNALLAEISVKMLIYYQKRERVSVES